MKKIILFLVAVMLVFFESDFDILAYADYEKPDLCEFSYSENISYSDYYDLILIAGKGGRGAPGAVIIEW